jgi:uncharacterized SAM-binding protein YcdF (DUF218 family)
MILNIFILIISLIIIKYLYQKYSRIQIGKPDIVIVLGAQIIINEENKILPSFHLETRLIAASEYYDKFKNINFIFSGGYCFGLRYTKNNIISSYESKSQFQNYSNARNIGPSESKLMKNFILSKNKNIKKENILLEESSTNTIENAKFCNIILERNIFMKKTISILTNLFHMKRSINIFNKYLNKNIIPIYSEDFCIFDNSKDWILLIINFYKKYKNFDIELLKEILIERKKGNLKRSVNEIIYDFD